MQLTGEPQQADHAAHGYKPPQHPRRGVPACGTDAPPRPEQQWQKAQQRHGGKLCRAQPLCLHEGVHQFHKKPSCQCQPHRKGGRFALQSRRCQCRKDAQAHRADCAQPQRPTHRDALRDAVCQRCCDHAEGQRRRGKTFCVLFHDCFLPLSHFCQILNPCRDSCR